MALTMDEEAAAGAVEAARGRWPTWTLVSAFWLASSLLYAAQVTLMSQMPGERFRLGTLLAWQLPFWLLWAVLTPVILWLGDRFPLDGRLWRRTLPLHLLAWVLLSALHSGAAVAIGQWLAPSANEGFLRAFRGFFLSRIHFELLVYAATIAIGYGLEYRRRLRARELSASRLETQLAHARLDALRMQLHPHFLFNTLHTVAALVRAQRNDEAVRMIAGLSDLLRRTLDGQPTQLSSLADELTFLERYLDIQRVRFGDRLQVELRIAPDTRDAQVPALILQPLVENALRHGLAPRAAAGRLTVTAARRDGRLRLEVIDNGVGWHAQAAQAAQAARHDAGVGGSSPRGAEDIVDRRSGHDDARDTSTATTSVTAASAGATSVIAASLSAMPESAKSVVATPTAAAAAMSKSAMSVAAASVATAAVTTAVDERAIGDTTPGVGLANTRARLRHLYGDAASLDLADAVDGGAHVTVRMPYRVAGTGADAGAIASADTDAVAGSGAEAM